MVLPVPSHPKVTCKFGKKGSAWSTGEHGGIDYGAPAGTPLFAPWGGQIVGVRSGSKTSGTTWGSAFGNHVVIDFDKLPDGSPGLWGVLAHMTKVVVKVGQRVAAGDQIGTVGDTGNASGAHCHFEVQKSSKWTRGNYVNPQPWIDAGQGGNPGGYKQGGKIYSSKMWHGQKDSDSVWNVQHALNANGADLPETGNYLDQTLAAVKTFQESQGWKGADADGIVGPGTARKLGLTWVDDGPPPPKPKSDDEPVWAGKLRKALACVSARVDYRPRWTDPAIAGKHTWNPSWVVLHHTGGTNSLNWIEGGADHPPVPAAGFLIARDGTVHVFSCYETYHAGAGGPLGGVKADAMNRYAWGIEIESPGKEKDLTDEQVKSAAQLCAGLIKHAGVLGAVQKGDPWQVINHKTWSSRKKDTLYSDSWWRGRIVAELEA